MEDVTDPSLSFLVPPQGMDKGGIKLAGINLSWVCSNGEHEIPRREYVEAKIQINSSKVTFSWLSV